MTLWIVEYVAGEPGCPLVLKGKLNRPWDWDAFDPEPAESVIESDYVLVTTNRRLDVDYWGVNRLGSEEVRADLPGLRAPARGGARASTAVRRDTDDEAVQLPALG
ncbi:hypothetical protein [Prescottella agglutinans]|uniref:hypothetical protein n=1 Tax=Prescottella agglutinans TaxID=1644129 RepID=UPI003D97B432